MSDQDKNEGASFLPVGMIANGGTYAQAIESAAIKKYNLPGWAPFHYAKVSDTEYECTGGFAIGSGGQKKWPEPHTSIIVNESEIAVELAYLLADDDASPAAAPQATSSQASQAPMAAASTPRPGGTPKYLTVVFQLPDDAAGQQRIKEAFRIDASFFGAQVTSVSTRLP
ncbi:hypothetical protein LPB67_12145 [Undibacterium sp. Jales W-56]|uniref:hypothetical protein n=1 Tax=Undibacterium sp. Jales W-56 TaxID=2897325 RepID=UPI0021CF1F27|nr:hypothetical protein [Undibacterium sp. Jales W-56]MCU6434523.1 hypothetical protein [Undibacterium sp. Jales W-56]